MKSKWHFLITLIVVFVCAISLFPLISMIIMTTKTTEEIFAGFSMVPGTHFIDNIKTVVGVDFLVS